MTFVQIIEGHTSDIEAMAGLERDRVAATEGRRTLRRYLVTRDRNGPTRFVTLAFFDS